MASSDESTPIFRDKDVGATINKSLIPLRRSGGPVNIKATRLLYLYCLINQVFSTLRAWEIYQDFQGWGNLNRKNKFFLTWGAVTTVAMAFFTLGWVVLEYRLVKRRRALRVV
ncbi:hypothetical protein F4777DRAFT_579829 [Nemania sp. FL0916]|nr:hypothetical protein F4777DRAFT_579829 [Nemania sp. FL0916]